VYNWGIECSRGKIDEIGYQDSVIGISISYWFVGLGFEPHSGGIFRTHPDQPREALRLLYNGYRATFPGMKFYVGSDSHPPRSTAGFKYSCTSTSSLCLLHHRRNVDINWGISVSFGNLSFGKFHINVFFPSLNEPVYNITTARKL
jgi:hypothetical protein